MSLYIYTPNVALRVLLMNLAEKRRKSDSGFDIPMLEQVVDNANMKHSFHLEIKVGAIDTNNRPVPCLLLPRSSLSNTTFRLSNSIGLIDSGYRGEVQARVDIIYPNSDFTTIQSGTRLFQICQHNFLPWEDIVIVQFPEELPEANDDRGAGGFGSTG